MIIAIDTNVYSEFMRGDSHCLSTLERATEIVVPIIVLAELRAGFAVGTRSRTNLEALEEFLQLPNISILSPDPLTAVFYADVFKSLRQQGTPIPSNDIWIAALAIQHNIPLFSMDKHFDRVANLLRA